MSFSHLAKKDPHIIKQAETNVIILNAILNSNLNCKAVVKKCPNVSWGVNRVRGTQLFLL